MKGIVYHELALIVTNVAEGSSELWQFRNWQFRNG